jgi:prepilin-type N-terminal cleavage/methylation domain-containing protein
MNEPFAVSAKRVNSLEGTSSRMKCSAFTLLELIVTLSVIAILAAVLAPLMIVRIDRLSRETEGKRLEVIVESIRQSVLRNKYIPAHTNWAQIVAAEMGASTADVLTNVRGAARVFLIDPEMEIGSNGLKLPYQQNELGSVVTNALGQVIPPVSPRILIVSSLADQTLPVSSGVASSASAFNAIWNTAEGAVPSGWPAGWTGKGDDLKIERINLLPLFKRLTLSNHDGPQGNYSIDGISTLVPENEGVNAFFLEHTVLGLHDTDGNMELSHIMLRNAMYVYEREVWRWDISAAQIRMFRSEMTADLFLDSNWNVRATGQPPTRQEDVFNAMKDYLTAYKNWAVAGFPSDQQNNPTWSAAKSAQNRLHGVTQDLMYNPACQ